MRLQLRAACGTHPGQIRPTNEDSVFAYIRPSDLGDPLGLLIVADGMGGHQAGEIASKLAVETIFQSLRKLLEANGTQDTQPLSGGHANEILQSRYAPLLSNRLQLAIEDANTTIIDYAIKHPMRAGNLGTTVACVVVKNSLAVIGNVGDSRVYRLSDSNLEQLTEDHSFVGQLVREGHLAPEAIFDHPHRSVITRALGHQPTVGVSISTVSINTGDRLLLCSDGLWEMIRKPSEIAQVLLDADNPTHAVENLINAANDLGGNDNISAIVCELVAEST